MDEDERARNQAFGALPLTFRLICRTFLFLEGKHESMSLCVLVSLVEFQPIPAAQVVQVGPTDPHYCERVHVRPNFIMKEAGRLSGKIIDQSGAPFQNSRVELRTYLSETKQIPLRSAVTDQEGVFRFDNLGPGRYRLLASPTRTFRQPEQFVCSRVDCDVLITLQASPTDLPDSQCPVK